MSLGSAELVSRRRRHSRHRVVPPGPGGHERRAGNAWCRTPTRSGSTRKTLIEARRFAAPDEAASDLAAKAAIPALERAGITAADLDYLIVSTSTGDSPQPPTSTLVQDLIGADRAACFDINVVCAGFVFGAGAGPQPGGDAAGRQGPGGRRRTSTRGSSTSATAAPRCCSATARAPPWSARSRTATASWTTELVSRGAANHLIRVDAGGSRLPASAETVANGDHFFKMDGRGVRDFVASTCRRCSPAMLERAGLHAEDVDHFVPHQANGVMLRELVDAGRAGRRHHAPDAGPLRQRGQRLGAGGARRGRPLGAVLDGDLVLLAGFGGGMAVGAAVLRWSD